jgi:hypothetical protein
MLLDAENGQKRLLGKVMGNLPALSRQIKSIQANPFAMRAFAKSLNLDMEMVQKMASSTESEMQDIMKEYEKKAEDDKALKKKQEQQKAEAAKFEDALTALKRKALMPLMNFVSNNLGNIMSLFSVVSNTFSAVLKAISPVLQILSDNIIKFSKDTAKFIGDFGPSFIKGFLKGVQDLWNMMKELYTYIEPIVNSIKSFASSFMPGSKAEGQKTAESGGEYVAKGGAMLAAGYGAFKLMKGVVGLISSRQKTVSNAKVGELADEIGKSVAKHGRGPVQMGFFKGPLASALTTAIVAAGAYKLVSSGIEEAGGSKRAEVMGGSAAAYYAGKSTMSGDTLKALSDASKGEGIRGKLNAFKESKNLSRTLGELEKAGVKSLDISKTWQFTSKETKELLKKQYGEAAEKTFESITKRLKDAGMSGTVIPKAPPSGVSVVKNELKDLLKSSFGGGSEGAQLRAQGGIKSLSNIKSFMKSGMLPTLLADIGGGYLAGKAAEMAGGNEIQQKAASNLGSYGASTAAAALYGGPVGAAINAAMIGAFRGIENSREMSKLMWSPFMKAEKDKNEIDKAADMIQAGLGGAMTLGLGFVLDDTIEMITGKKSEIGKQMTAVVSNTFLPLTVGIRGLARVYDKAAEGFDAASKKYSAQFSLLNREMDAAGKKMNDQIKSGDYFGALKSIGSMLSISLDKYILSPIGMFFTGLKNSAIGMLAGIERKANEYNPLFKTNVFIPMEERLKTESKLLGRATEVMEAGNLDYLRIVKRDFIKKNVDTTQIDKMISILEADYAQKEKDRREAAANKQKERDDFRNDVRSGVGAGMKDAKTNEKTGGDVKPQINADLNSQLIADLVRHGLLLKP